MLRRPSKQPRYLTTANRQDEQRHDVRRRWNTSEQALRFEGEQDKVAHTRWLKRTSEIQRHRVDRMYFMNGLPLHLHDRYEIFSEDLKRMREFSKTLTQDDSASPRSARRKTPKAMSSSDDGPANSAGETFLTQTEQHARVVETTGDYEQAADKPEQTKEDDASSLDSVSVGKKSAEATPVPTPRETENPVGDNGTENPDPGTKSQDARNGIVDTHEICDCAETNRDIENEVTEDQMQKTENDIKDLSLSDGENAPEVEQE